MSQREDRRPYDAATVVPQCTTRMAVRSPNMIWWPGHSTANAPQPQGRTRPDALVTLAGCARRRREIWRNPSGLSEGVALQNGAQ